MKKIDKKYNLTLLYIEDEPFILKNAVEFLSDYFLEVYKAQNGKKALQIYKEKNPDIIITDIQMPHMDGLEFCREVRKTDETTPIIITTAFANQEYLLQAIELNLVKYLIKPLDEESLLGALDLCEQKISKRDKSVVRLSQKHYFDSFNKTLFYDDELVKLTSNELGLLQLLVEKKDRIISYKEIENYVYDGEYMSEDALKSLIKSLRKKITKSSIQNHSKLGYKVHIYDR